MKNRGKKVLEEWQEQLKDLPKIKLQDAQRLYQKFLEEENKDEKAKIREELIISTLYIVSYFLEKNTHYFVNSGSFDMNDIISVCNEEWIKYIDEGVLLNISSYSQIFDMQYFTRIIFSLIGDHKDISDITILNSSNFAKILNGFILLKRKQEKITYLNFLKYFNLEDSQHEIFAQYTYQILTVLADFYLKIDQPITQTKIHYLKYLLIHYALEVLKINLIASYYDMESLVINKMCNEEFIKIILEDPTLTEREKEIIVLRFGLLNNDKWSYCELAKKFGVTKERIRQVEAKVLRKLCFPSRSRKIKKIIGMEV